MKYAKKQLTYRYCYAIIHCSLFHKEKEWSDFEIKTGEKIVREKISYPDIENVNHDEEGNVSIPVIEKETEKIVHETIIKIPVLPSYSDYVWDAEYDASQNNTTSFLVPCWSIIEYLSLRQKGTDGCYFSENGELVCFAGRIAGICEA